MKEIVARPAPARLRRLSEEEIELWSEVAKSVARRRGAILPTLAQPRQARPRARRWRPATAQIARLTAAGEPSPPALAPLERRLKRELARGHPRRQALDLHGLNQAEAHVALRGFLARRRPAA